jgi:hypothetical protein
MTWTEGCLRISDTIAIHGGYLGIISFGICVIVIILYLLFVGAAGAMLGDTIKELNEKSKR